MPLLILIFIIFVVCCWDVVVPHIVGTVLLFFAYFFDLTNEVWGESGGGWEERGKGGEWVVFVFFCDEQNGLWMECGVFLGVFGI